MYRKIHKSSVYISTSSHKASPSVQPALCWRNRSWVPSSLPRPPSVHYTPPQGSCSPDPQHHRFVLPELEFAISEVITCSYFASYCFSGTITFIWFSDIFRAL